MGEKNGNSRGLRVFQRSILNLQKTNPLYITFYNVYYRK